jgi:hypothetical protein
MPAAHALQLHVVLKGLSAINNKSGSSMQAYTANS